MLLNKAIHLLYLSTLLLLSSTSFAADDGWDPNDIASAIEASKQQQTTERSFMDDYEDAVRLSLLSTSPQPAAAARGPALAPTPGLVPSGRRAPIVHYQDTSMSEDDAFQLALKLSATQETEKKATDLAPAPLPAFPPKAAATYPVPARTTEQPREVKIPVQLAPQHTDRQTATQQQLEDLVGYLLRMRYDVRNVIGNIMEAHFEGIVNPGCMFADPIAPLFANPFAVNPLESAKEKIRGSFKEYCGGKGYDYNAALPLLEHMLQRYVTDEAVFKQYLEAYGRVYSTLSAPTLSLLPLIKTKLAVTQDMAQPQAFERIAEADRALEAGIKGHEIVKLFETLRAEHDRVAAFLRTPIPPAAFLANAPKIDLALLFKVKEATTQPADKAPVEPAKPKYIDRTSSPLDPKITVFKDRLDQLFADKIRTAQQQLAESVMVFGQSVAPVQYKAIEDNINRVWNVLPKPTVPLKPITTIKDLVAFYRPILTDLGHTVADVQKVEEALNQSSPTQPANQYDINILRDIRPHDYLFMVFAHIYRFYQIAKPHNPGDANTLMAMFFNGIIEQGTHCQAGLVGRLHQIHKQTLDIMIDYYYHTPIQ